MTTIRDIGVIGLGAMGSAAIWQLALRGADVIGFDQFNPPHEFGSSHGESRVIRQTTGEGPEYVPLAQRSYEIWTALARSIEKELFHTPGFLIIQKGGTNNLHGASDFFRQTLTCAEQRNIPHEVLNAHMLKQRFPQFKIYGNEVGFIDYTGGYAFPEACISAQLSEATRLGAQLYPDTLVKTCMPINKNRIDIETSKGMFSVNTLIVTTGPWMHRLLDRSYSERLSIHRQVLYWFDVSHNYDSYVPEIFPPFIVIGRLPIYGFPALHGKDGGIKLATEQYTETTTPENLKRTVSCLEINRFHQSYVNPHLVRLDNSRVINAKVCMYTVAPNARFAIGIHPTHNNIIYASPCSGHGFKHSAAIGEALAEIALGTSTTVDVTPFALHNLRTY